MTPPRPATLLRKFRAAPCADVSRVALMFARSLSLMPFTPLCGRGGVAGIRLTGAREPAKRPLIGCRVECFMSASFAVFAAELRRRRKRIQQHAEAVGMH